MRLWVPHLYGRAGAVLLGAARGYAGIANAIISSAELLDEIDLGGFANEVARTVSALALRDGGIVNWPRMYGALEPVRDDPVIHASLSNRLQWCNGSAGLVSALNSIPLGVDSEFDALLVAAGETTWKVGAPRGDASFCDGAAGNGWAFLKLHRRTGSTLWLDRARSYAMHAIHTIEMRRALDKRVSFTLWPGDLGAAAYIAGCLEPDDRIPAIDTIRSTRGAAGSEQKQAE